MKNKKVLLAICCIICVLLCISTVNAGIFEFKEDTSGMDNNISDDVEQRDEDIKDDVDPEKDDSESDVTALDFMNITPNSKDTTVKIGGVDFNIPKGFGENLNLAKNSDDDESLNKNSSITSFSRVFFDEEHMVIITVFYNDAQSAEIEDFTLESNEVEKTISSYDGIFYVNDEGDYCDFTYCVDGKVVMVGGDNEDVISEFIV